MGSAPSLFLASEVVTFLLVTIVKEVASQSGCVVKMAIYSLNIGPRPPYKTLCIEHIRQCRIVHSYSAGTGYAFNTAGDRMVL